MSKTKIEQIQDITNVQCGDGNWNYDPYMQGLANGLLLAVHILEDKEGAPDYKQAPEHWLSDLKTLEKFNNSGTVIK